jgi:hypothetical protein
VAVGAVITQPQKRGRDVKASLLVAVQLFVAGDYLLTALLASPGSARAAAQNGPLGDPLDWLWALGYFITTLSGPVMALLAILGGAQIASHWADRRSRPMKWLLAGTALCVALFILGLTPAGRELSGWTAS